MKKKAILEKTRKVRIWMITSLWFLVLDAVSVRVTSRFDPFPPSIQMDIHLFTCSFNLCPLLKCFSGLLKYPPCPLDRASLVSSSIFGA
jgi:hypothetical protein